jgi:hypothetical protein
MAVKNYMLAVANQAYSLQLQQLHFGNSSTASSPT